ncbi:MAG: aldo/keto reductase [Pseudomonadota bacterium]
MKYRKLLKDGSKVSEIGLGCWSFAGAYGETSEAESHQTLQTAQELGIDFLDTANVYGMGVSETVMGTFLKSRTHSFKIATKAGIWRDPNTGARGFNNKPDYLRGELENSLKRLGHERVDLYYIHRRDADIEIEAVMEALLTFKTEGKIGGIGFSEISPTSLRRAAAVGPVDAVQSEYSLWTRQPEMGMVQACAELDVTFVPFSPLARGMLAPTPPDPASFPEGHFRKGTPRFTEPNFSRNVARIEGFKALASDLGTSPVTLALAWVLAKDHRFIPIPGTRSSEHLRICAAASDFAMTVDVMSEIEAALPLGWAHGDRYSRAQWPGVEHYY